MNFKRLYPFIILAIALVIMGLASSPFVLMTGSGILGFAAGMNSPAVFSWAIERCSPAHRGRAMATVYIALEVGIGLGAVVSAWLYHNDYSRFGLTFYTFAGIALLAPLYLQFIYKEENTVYPGRNDPGIHSN